ncbi:hypothetical protein, partial [Dickeya undicola]|uniref:hypothetical protein n=1 Tax=Dickeya undicola TaxID=1577887 RepID=UPI000532AFAA
NFNYTLYVHIRLLIAVPNPHLNIIAVAALKLIRHKLTAILADNLINYSRQTNMISRYIIDPLCTLLSQQDYE